MNMKLVEETELEFRRDLENGLDHAEHYEVELNFLFQTIKQQQEEIDGLKGNLKETYQFLAEKDVWLQEEADEEIKALEGGGG